MRLHPKQWSTKNGKSVVRRCHKFYGKGLPLTLDILKQTFRLMLKPSSVI